MKAQGARAKMVVIDASPPQSVRAALPRLLHGLAPINAHANALILSSATPGKVAEDSASQNSVLIGELLNHLNAKPMGAEAAFNKNPHRDLPRLRRRAGALRLVLAPGRSPLRQANSENANAGS